MKAAVNDPFPVAVFLVALFVLLLCWAMVWLLDRRSRRRVEKRWLEPPGMTSSTVMVDDSYTKTAIGWTHSTSEASGAETSTSTVTSRDTARWKCECGDSGGCYLPMFSDQEVVAIRRCHCGKTMKAENMAAWQFDQRYPDK